MEENKKPISLTEIFSDAKKRDDFVRKSRLVLLKITQKRNRINRIEHNKMMYSVFTPILVQLWHKLLGKKPYLNINYRPKI